MLRGGLLILSALTFPFFSHAADFEIRQPGNWKNVFDQNGITVYQNHRSQGKFRVAVQKLSIDGNDQSAFLKKNLAKVAKVRRSVLSSFGLRNYSIVSHEKKKSTVPGFKTTDVIYANYNGAKGEIVQVVERQFVRDHNMYVVTYVESMPAINDSHRVEIILDSFLPNIGRAPASADTAQGATDQTNAEGTTKCVNADCSDQKTPEQITLKIPTADELNTVCADVPPEKRRGSGMNLFLPSHITQAASCIKGGGTAALNFFTGLTDLAVKIKDYAVDPKFRDQVNTTASIVAAQISLNPAGVAADVALAVGTAALKYSQKFALCLNADAMAEALCYGLTNFIPAGLVLKLLARAALTAEEIAIISRGIEQAIGKVTVAVKPAKVVIKEGLPDGVTLGPANAYGHSGRYLHLVTKDQFNQFPNGTVFYSIDGKRLIKGTDQALFDFNLKYGKYSRYGLDSEDVRLKKVMPTEDAIKVASTGSVPANPQWTAAVANIEKKVTELKTKPTKETIKELGDLDINSLDRSGIPKKEVSKQATVIANELSRLVKDAPDLEIREEALKALIKFGNKNGKIGIVNAKTMELLEEIKDSKEFSESLRKIASARLTAETYGATAEAKQAIFEALEAGKGIPKEFIREAADQLQVTTVKGLQAELKDFGYLAVQENVQMGSELVPALKFYNAATKSTIIIQIPKGIDRRLTPDEIARIIKAIQNEGYYRSGAQ